MDLNYIIETLEPERDQLFKEMKHYKRQYHSFNNMAQKYLKQIEENEEKIKQIDFILDNYAYKKPS